MIAVERLEVEIAKIDAILAKRGALYEDEKVRRDSFREVKNWMQFDKDEADRIELEAMEAEELAVEEAKKADPNYKTRQLFEGVKITIPPGKGRK